jgi:signal transduction histidine kinase
MVSPEAGVEPGARPSRAPAAIRVEPRPRFRAILEPVVLGVGAIVAVFGSYELIETTLLANAEPSVIRAAHVARGVTGSVAAALIVAWSIIRRSPALLGSNAAGARAGLEGDVLRESAQWYLSMRWLAIIGVLAMSVLAVPIAGVLPSQVLWPLLAGVAALALTNVGYALLLARARPLRGLLIGQIHADLVIFAFLLHFAGGLENPIYALPLLHVVLAGVLLPPRHGYLTAITAAALLAAVGFSEWAQVIAHYPLALGAEVGTGSGPGLGRVSSQVGVQAALYMLVAYLVTTLAERSRANEHRFSTMVDRALAERQLLERALETTGTGLRVVDHQCKPRWSNRRWGEWFPKSHGEGRANLVARTVEDGRVRVSELTVAGSCDFGPEPYDRTLQITTAPITDAADQVVEVVELVQEITELKRAQAQMVRAGSMAAVGELAGQVAHEVNNPIAIISAKARLMLSGHRAEMSEKIASELGKIIALSDRVAGIAQGLLSYCRPSARTRAALDLREPVREAISIISQRARTSNITIEDELRDPLGPVLANAGEMGQVLLNLLLNALDSMPDGGTLKVIGLPDAPALPDGKPSIGVAVVDSGPGISDEIQGRIWEPFFSTKPEGRGTGLGLSICLGLINDHGGVIELENLGGEGACFTVRLPLAAGAEEEEHAEATHSRSG